MGKVRYDQAGYCGCSMSERAVEAYKDGEMPKSKWTKKAMMKAIEGYCLDEPRTYTRNLGSVLCPNVQTISVLPELEYDPRYIGKMTKDAIFDRFFCWKSWHHTGKFANETDFYGIDEDKLYMELSQVVLRFSSLGGGVYVTNRDGEHYRIAFATHEWKSPKYVIDCLHAGDVFATRIGENNIFENAVLHASAVHFWKQLADVPIDDNGITQEPFLIFPANTNREMIWHWFEDRYRVSVATDLMRIA